jgi:ACS family glucarate transporter-like MFS transporter
LKTKAPESLLPNIAPLNRRIPVRYYLCFWLFVLSAITFLDRTNISLAGLQLSREFGLGNQRLGWIFSAFLLGYAGFQIPAGVLAVRFGPRKVLTFGILLWAVATACTALLPSGLPHVLAVLLSIRFLLGMGESVIFPAANQWVARWIPQRERGTVNGVIFAGVGVGSGLTPPLITWIIQNYGWRGAFWFTAALMTMGATVWWIISRDTPEEHPWVSEEERAEIRAGLASLAAAKPGQNSATAHKIAWAAMLKRRDLYAMMVSYFAFGYTAYIYFSWFFIYMATARGLNLRTSAKVSMLPFILMTICCLGGGAISDRLTKSIGLRAGRCGLASVAQLLAALFLILGSRVPNPFAAAGILALGAGSLYLSQTSFWSASTDIAGKNSGVFSALVNMVNQLGGALTASLTPWLALHYNWKMPFTVAAILGVMGALAWLTVHPERPLEVEV